MYHRNVVPNCQIKFSTLLVATCCNISVENLCDVWSKSNATGISLISLSRFPLSRLQQHIADVQDSRNLQPATRQDKQRILGYTVSRCSVTVCCQTFVADDSATDGARSSRAHHHTLPMTPKSYNDVHV